jgi:four helix bundle protein
MDGMDRHISPERARTLALQERSFELTCAIICAYPHQHYIDDPSRIIWGNLIRATSSSTFNLEEADGASSDRDFVAKMRIALREAKETRVSIRIIVRCKLAGHADVGRYEDESNQLAAIFRTIIKNKLKNMQAKSAHS